MVNKLDEMSATVSSNLYDVVVIIETWLNPSVTDELIRVPGYVSCRRDRPNNQPGGGLCTYISSRLNFLELTDLSDPEIESQWFLIRLDRLPRGINSIILGTVYHPPQSDDHVLRMHILINVQIPYSPPTLILPFWFLVISINLNQAIFVTLLS
jgi:hypothetical protein